MSDKNLNTGDDSAESQNLASKKAREAQDMLRAKIGLETKAALSVRDDAAQFADENLSTADRASQFVKNVWKGITENPAFRDVVLSDEEMSTIAKSVREEFVKNLTLLDRERAAVLETINAEFDLSTEQFNALQEDISAIPGEDLGSYRTASYRNLYLSRFFLRRNESLPFARKVADRFRKLFGNEWAHLDNQSKEALVSAEKSRSMNMANLMHLWSRLGDAARVEMISFLTLNLSFQSLNQLDDHVFSKKKIVQASRRSIEAHLSPKSREALEKIEDLKLGEILEKLEWSDVASMKVSQDAILQLMKNPNTYVLTKKFAGLLQDWFDEELETEISERERKAKEAGEATQQDPSDVPPVSEEWARGLSQELSEKNNSTIEGAHLFAHPAFLNGKENLVCRIAPRKSSGEARLFLLQINDAVPHVDGKPQGFFTIPLDSDSKPLYERKAYLPSTAFVLLASETSQLSIQHEEVFYKAIGNEVPGDVFDESELDRTPLDPDAVVEEDQVVSDGIGQNISVVLRENNQTPEAPTEGADEKKWTNLNYKAISEEWIRELVLAIGASGATIEWAERINSSDFLNGRKKLLVHLTTPTGSKTFQLRTGYHAKDADGKSYGFYAVPVNQDGTLDYVGGKPYLTGEVEQFFQGASHIEITPDMAEETTPEAAAWNGGNGNVPPANPNGTAGSGAESEPADPHTLDEFHAALSKNYNNSAKLEAGGCISFYKPGTSKYVAYRILSLDENSLTVWGGSSAFPAETIGYADLYEKGVQEEIKHFKILPNKLGNSAEFLATMQSESSQKDAWKEIEITTDEDGNEIFDFIDRRFDTTKTKKHYFPGASGTIMEIIAIHDGVAEVRIGENFEKSTKNEVASTADWFAVTEYPLQYVIQYLIRNACTPWNEPPREIPSRKVPEGATKTTAGKLKAAFGRYSIHDLISGSKKFIDEFKHHLQHGNHLQEQRIMLGIAKRTGMDSWNSEWFADFKSLYENGEKKLIEERLETLGKMGTPDRQKSIRASLFNNGTHDYDHWTNALSMVEKHGQLYAGELRDLEGSWIFFKRIAGIPLGDNVNDYKEFQKIVGDIRRKGIDNITEEAVIEEYMKTDPHFANAQIWRMLKKRVKEGNENEQKSGADETEQFINLEQRLNYAMGKLESKEYAHAIGAMEKVFEKEGPAYKKQSIAFMLAMSRIPERLPRPLLDRFVKIFDEGRLHSPALAFIKDRQSQEKFRDAVKAIVKVKAQQQRAAGVTSPTIEKDFDEMMAAIKSNTDVMKEHKKGGAPSTFETDMFKKTKSFWEKHGKDIQYELTGNPKGTVLISKETLDKNPALAAYKAIMKKQLGDTNIHHPVELDKSTPFMDGEEGAGVISFKPDKIIDKMGLQIHHGGFSGSNLESAIQADFRASMKEIRGKEAHIMSRDDKRAWFKDVYTEYVKKITATSNLTEFLKQESVKPFNQLGLVPPPIVLPKKIKEKIEELEAKLRKTKLDAATKRGELQRLQKKINGDQNPTADEQTKITNLNEEIIKTNQEVTYLQKEIQKTDALSGQYVAFNDRDEMHQAHFEEQFEVFLGEKAPTVIQENVSGLVNEIMSDTYSSNDGASRVGSNDVESPAPTGTASTDGSGNS